MPLEMVEGDTGVIHNIVRLVLIVFDNSESHEQIAGCWITAGFPVQRIVLEYLWLWTTALLDLLLYIPLYLVIRGFLVVEGYRVYWVKPSLSQRQMLDATRVAQSRNAKEIALQMLL